jgi:hypothetical protein
MVAGVWAKGSKGDGRFTLAASAGFRAQNASSLKNSPEDGRTIFQTGQGRSTGGTGND